MGWRETDWRREEGGDNKRVTLMPDYDMCRTCIMECVCACVCVCVCVCTRNVLGVKVDNCDAIRPVMNVYGGG